MADRDHLFGRSVGEFIIGELLDEGGYGKVYRGKQPILGREAIIKLLHPRLRVEDIQCQRFLREAQLASKLDHPYAAHIYAFNVESDGLLWIAMECVRGTPLNDWLRDHGPMPLEQLVPFFEDIAEVVQNAHERGIVHRDLKPSNIMVIERAGRLYPKLLDFGIAKLLNGETLPDSTPDTLQRIRAIGAKRMREFAVEQTPAKVLDQIPAGPSTATGNSPAPDGDDEGRLTPEDATIGTPGYMAPEQWNRQFTVGPAADLYALGVVAFEGLTGGRPSDGMSEIGTVPRLGGHLPPALDQVFQRALAWRPEDRFGTARELAGALRQASGIGATRSDLPAADLRGPDLPGPDLPRIDEDVRNAWLAMAPQPLAESVAMLDSARNAHQAHIATQDLARNLLRYLLVVALAMRAKAREDQDDPALLDLVRALDRRALSTEERVRLLRLLVRPLISRRGAPAPPSWPS